MSARRFLVGLVVGLCALMGVSIVMGAPAFASAPETPSAVTVESIKAESAILRGLLNPGAEGEAGTYEFLYKASATECQGAGTARGLAMGLLGEEVSQKIEGLSPDTEYAVCLLARTLSGETSVGPVSTFKTALPPETPVTEKATAVTARSAMLHGVLNPANPGESGTYRFEYAASATECQGQGSTSPVPATGLEQEAVSSEVTELLPNTTYTFCVLASNAAEETSLGAPQTFTTPGSSPALSEESVQDAAATEATLVARLDPGGKPTHYYVEYGPGLPYSSSTSEREVSSNESLNIQVHLSNLQPGIVYQYRFVVSNSLGAVQGADQAFSTYPTATSTILPDNRGYEKVSSSNNADSNVYEAWSGAEAPLGGWTELPFEASAEGNAVAYIGGPSEEGGAGKEGANGGNQYLARRGASGSWEASNITPPSENFYTVPEYQGFSHDFTHGFVTTQAEIPLVADAPAGGYQMPYVRDFATGGYEALLSSLPVDRSRYEFGAYETRTGAGRSQPIFAGSSSDFSHILLMANDALTSNATDGGQEDNQLYNYHNGALNLVNILPDGASEPSAVFGGPAIASFRREVTEPDFSHAVSEDGTRIFWTGQGANQNIYLREDGTRTVQVDAALGGGGQFWAASPDGSSVLFTKAGDLYEYNVASEQTARLTVGAEVQGVVGTSEDLSYVYFVANGDLASGATPGTCTPDEEQGQCGLYAIRAGGPIRFIAMLAARDDTEGVSSYETLNGDWRGGLGERESQVTPDGRHLLFGSILPLTGFPHKGTTQIEQMFLYDYDDAKLNCISCRSSSETRASSFLPVSHEDSYSLRPMAEDGNRVFFDSQTALVPQDTNGKTDVYEWERDGAGTCLEEDGCIYLISDGTGDGGYLIDASTNGNDVFFTTRTKLVEEDQNEDVDAYDAHVGALKPPVPPQCTGTGCQGLPSAPPVFATPSSVTYNGVGNFPPPSHTKAKGRATKKKVKKVRAKSKVKKSKFHSRKKKKHTPKHGRGK